MGLGDYGSFNEIVTKIVQGENIENAIPTLCFEWPIHIFYYLQHNFLRQRSPCSP